MLTALAAATTGSRRLGAKIRIATEATQFDTYKNRDLLPVAARAGLFAIWFGIEDLTAELVNKGQKPAVTAELFRILHQYKISPMAMPRGPALPHERFALWIEKPGQFPEAGRGHFDPVHGPHPGRRHARV